MKHLFLLLLLLVSATLQAQQVTLIALEGNITAEKAAKIEKRLTKLSEKDGNEAYILIESQGGDAGAALALYDAIVRLKPKMKIHTHALSVAGQGAALVLAAGTEGCRYSDAKSTIMIQKAKALGTSAEEADRFNSELVKIISGATGKTAKEIEAELEESDETWMTPEVAVVSGLIDAVLKPGVHFGTDIR